MLQGFPATGRITANRMRLKLATGVVFFALLVIYGLLVREQKVLLDPAFVRSSLEGSGQMIPVGDWSVILKNCKGLDTRSCLEVSRLTVPGFPAPDLLRAAIAGAPVLPNTAELLHQLTEKEAAWIRGRGDISLVLPRMVHNSTWHQGISGDRVEVGMAANISFPVKAGDYVQGRNLRLVVDFTGYEWFGPADAPVVLAMDSAIGAYENLGALAYGATFFSRQLEIGLPLVISGMALILDHSLVFPSLSVYGLVRALRVYRAFDKEQENALLSDAASQVFLLLVNMLTIPSLLYFVAAASGIRLTRPWTAALVIFFCAGGAIHLLGGQFYEFESDLWIDAVGAIIAVPIACCGYFNRIRDLVGKRKRGKRNVKTTQGADHRLTQASAVWFLLTFALAVTAYANISDLIIVRSGGFKDQLNWAHSALVPLCIIAAMVDIGSMTRKMKDYGKTMVDRALIDKDLSIGKRMQTLLLPPKRGMTETWRWRTTYCPSMTLAGDWFDVRRIRTSNGRDYLLCCVVDVTGHGVSSALISTAISSHWSMWCEGRDGGLGPESDREREKLILEAPNHIHRGLATLREASGCTAAFMILDESSNRLSYCTAGHPGIIFISSVGEMRYLFTPGTRPGFTDSAVGWTARSTEANVGDMFFLYSDGVVPSDLPFSVWLKKLGGRDRSGTDAVAKSLLEDIRRNKSQFRKNRHQEDDMSLVMLKRIA